MHLPPISVYRKCQAKAWHRTDVGHVAISWVVGKAAIFGIVLSGTISSTTGILITAHVPYWLTLLEVAADSTRRRSFNGGTRDTLDRRIKVGCLVLQCSEVTRDTVSEVTDVVLPSKLNLKTAILGDLTVPVEGVTLKNAWRNLKMDVVIDGERYYLDTSHVTNDEYTRSTMRYIEKMPEQVLLYTEETADTPLVYDVSGGIFVG